MTKLFTITHAAIANGQSLSEAIYCGNRRLVSIQMPAAWDAANLTFQGSHDGLTYQDLYDAAGNEVTVTAAEGHAIGVSFEVGEVWIFAGWPWLKIRSGTSATPVNQTAARSLSLSMNELVG